VEYSIGDLLDRKSILELKLEKGSPERHQTSVISTELKKIKTELSSMKQDDVLSYLGAMIKKYNEQIWDLESAIRRGKENTLPLNELTGLTDENIKKFAVVGKRALQIREHNKKRIKFKNDANKKFGKGFQEIKLKHTSEEGKT